MARQIKCPLLFFFCRFFGDFSGSEKSEKLFKALTCIPLCIYSWLQACMHGAIKSNIFWTPSQKHLPLLWGHLPPLAGGAGMIRYLEIHGCKAPKINQPSPLQLSIFILWVPRLNDKSNTKLRLALFIIINWSILISIAVRLWGTDHSWWTLIAHELFIYDSEGPILDIQDLSSASSWFTMHKLHRGILHLLQ